jgi:hypothetical protein
VTRQAWREVAESLAVPFVEIQVICSDKDEHRRRVTTRETDIIQKSAADELPAALYKFPPPHADAGEQQRGSHGVGINLASKIREIRSRQMILKKQAYASDAAFLRKALSVRLCIRIVTFSDLT